MSILLHGATPTWNIVSSVNFFTEFAEDENTTEGRQILRLAAIALKVIAIAVAISFIPACINAAVQGNALYLLWSYCQAVLWHDVSMTSHNAQGIIESPTHFYAVSKLHEMIPQETMKEAFFKNTLLFSQL